MQQKAEDELDKQRKQHFEQLENATSPTVKLRVKEELEDIEVRKAYLTRVPLDNPKPFYLAKTLNPNLKRSTLRLWMAHEPKLGIHGFKPSPIESLTFFFPQP